MKVLHLTTHLNTGGITLYILHLIRHLKKLGVDTCVLSSGGAYAEAFEKEGARLFTLPIRTKSVLNPKLYFALPAMMKIIRENQVDILHAHTRITQVQAALIRIFTGIPVVTTFHGFYKYRLGRRLFPAVGDRAIAISQPVGESLETDHHVPKDKITVINNGVDVPKIEQAFKRHRPEEAKKSFGFQPDDPVLGVVARLVEDKGHEYLIRVMPPLLKRYPQMRLVIVGEGRERVNLERLVVSLNLEKHVVFTGNLLDITQALAAMDIFVFTPTWREGFGLSIVEAMVCGKPVITSNIWALNTLIEDHTAGILVSPKNLEQIEKAIVELMENKSLRDTMCKTAREMVEKYFSITRMSEELVKTYKSVLRS